MSNAQIQPDLICLDPNDITRVNENLLEDTMEERKKILYVRPLPVEYTPKHKMRGRASGGHKVNIFASAIKNILQEMRKQVVKGNIRVEQNKEREAVEKEVFGRGEKKEMDKPKKVLDRFRS